MPSSVPGSRFKADTGASACSRDPSLGLVFSCAEPYLRPENPPCHSHLTKHVHHEVDSWYLPARADPSQSSHEEVVVCACWSEEQRFPCLGLEQRSERSSPIARVGQIHAEDETAEKKPAACDDFFRVVMSSVWLKLDTPPHSHN